VILTAAAALTELRCFKKSKAAGVAFLAVGSLALFFMSAFRLNTGYDYPEYARFFMNTIPLGAEELTHLRFEKGYVLLNRLIQIFTYDFRALFIVTSLIVTAIVAVALLKNCANPSCGLLAFYLLGYWFNSLNFMRSMLAAVIILYAFKFIRSADFLSFAVAVLFASTFHISALLMLPFFFILRIKFNVITLTLYCAVGGTFLHFSVPVMAFITKYIYPIYNPAVSDNMTVGVPMIYALCLGLLFIFAFVNNKYAAHVAANSSIIWHNILVNTAFFSFYFEFVGAKHSVLGRFTMFFGPAVAVYLIPEILESAVRKKNLASCLSIAGIAAAAFVYFVYAVTHNYNGVIPLSWIWEL
jgi:hypothetical protein